MINTKKSKVNLFRLDNYLFYFLAMIMITIIFVVILIIFSSLNLNLRWPLVTLFSILSLSSFTWIIFKISHLIKKPVFSNPLYLFLVISIFSITSGLAIYYFLYDSSINDEIYLASKGDKIFNKIRLSLEQRFAIHDEQIKKIYGFDLFDNDLVVYHLNETPYDDKYYISCIGISKDVDDVNSAFYYIDEFGVGDVTSDIVFIYDFKNPYMDNTIKQKLDEFDFAESIHFLNYETISNQRYSIEVFNVMQKQKNDYLLIKTSHSNKEVKYLKTNGIGYHVFSKMIAFYK